MVGIRYVNSNLLHLVEPGDPTRVLGAGNWLPMLWVRCGEADGMVACVLPIRLSEALASEGLIKHCLCKMQTVHAQLQLCGNIWTLQLQTACSRTTRAMSTATW